MAAAATSAAPRSAWPAGKQVAHGQQSLVAAAEDAVDRQHRLARAPVGVREARPSELPPADLYLFSSPGRWGKPIGRMRRFLQKVGLPAGTRYAILTTEMAPKPDKTGHVPTEQELARWQRVRPIMNEILQDKGLVEVAEDKIQVTGIKGPLEEGWQQKVAACTARIPTQA